VGAGIFCLLLAATLPAAETVAPVEGADTPISATASVDVDGLSPQGGALLDACFDDYNRLNFDPAEAEAREAMAAQPELPLPVIYLQAVLVSEVQELTLGHADDSAVRERFDQATVLALRLEAAWEKAHHDGRGQNYLGISLGERGLVQLYRGHLLAAYKDGKRSNEALLLAQQRDPSLIEADLGRGQYLYYCGRLSGFLRLILVLHGDIPGGINLLQTCGVGGRRCAPLARLMLAGILTDDVPDYARALPYVQEAESRYPQNWSYDKLALDEARGLGLANPAALALVEAVSAQWDSGWRPPPYAALDPDPMRLQLAKWYLGAGREADARRHLTAIEQDKGKSAAEARQLEQSHSAVPGP
jgi:hypothetical protein